MAKYLTRKPVASATSRSMCPAKDAEPPRRSLLALGLQVQSPRAGAANRALYFADHDNNLFEVCFVQPVLE
jgi:hypothetical protein